VLTQILKSRPDVASRLASLVDLPPFDWLENPMVMRALPRNPGGEHAAIVGTAFDYMLRWEIQRRNPRATDRGWVAEEALVLMKEAMDKGTVAPELYNLYRTVVGEVGRFVRKHYLKSASPSTTDITRLATSALCLARIDPFFRTGTVFPDVHQCDKEDLADMLTLFDIAAWDKLGTAPPFIPYLNPSFGRISERFNGADADLIIGNGDGTATVIDFKTVKVWGIEKYLAQIVGYSMIVDLYRESEEPNFPRITRTGIYFARHGGVETFDFDAVRAHPDFLGAREALLDAADIATGRKTTTEPVSA
jgi:hypothetical protein